MQNIETTLFPSMALVYIRNSQVCALVLKKKTKRTPAHSLKKKIPSGKDLVLVSKYPKSTPFNDQRFQQKVPSQPKFKYMVTCL